MKEKLKKVVPVLLIVLGLVGYGGYRYVDSIYQENYPVYIERLTDLAFQQGLLKVRVDISVRTLEYHSLGRELSVETTCNGRSISDGDIIYAEPVLKFETELTERDSIPDRNSGGAVLHLPPLERSVSHEITVRERGGRRYPNAYAVYEVTYQTTPLDYQFKTEYWDVVFMEK